MIIHFHAKFYRQACKHGETDVWKPHMISILFAHHARVCFKKFLFQYIQCGIVNKIITTSHVEGCKVLRSACVCVCLCVGYVCPLACLNNQTSKLRRIFYARFLWLSLGPSTTRMQYIVYFWFYGIRQVFTQRRIYRRAVYKECILVWNRQRRLVIQAPRCLILSSYTRTANYTPAEGQSLLSTTALSVRCSAVGCDAESEAGRAGAGGGGGRAVGSGAAARRPAGDGAPYRRPAAAHRETAQRRDESRPANDRRDQVVLEPASSRQPRHGRHLPAARRVRQQIAGRPALLLTVNTLSETNLTDGRRMSSVFAEILAATSHFSSQKLTNVTILNFQVLTIIVHFDYFKTFVMPVSLKCSITLA